MKLQLVGVLSCRGTRHLDICGIHGCRDRRNSSSRNDQPRGRL